MIRHARAAALLLLAACTGTHFDDLPKPWRCETSSDCSSGWRCGVDGYCYDRTTARDVRCRADAGIDDGDCAVGWRCGADGLCFERAAATVRACVRSNGITHEEGGDCASGWRCGLEGECHDLSAGGPFACAFPSDEECAAGWRCDVVGRCVAVGDESSAPAPALGLSSLLNPQVAASLSSGAFQSSEPLAIDGGVRRWLTGARGDRVWLAKWERHGDLATYAELPSPGRLDVEDMQGACATGELVTFAANDAGVTVLVAATAERRATSGVSGGPETLRCGDDGALAIRAKGSVEVLDGKGFRPVGRPTAGRDILDFVAWALPDGGVRVVGLDDVGLWTWPPMLGSANAGWTPLLVRGAVGQGVVDNTACTPSQQVKSLSLERLRSLGGAWLAVAGADRGGQGQVLVLDAAALEGNTNFTCDLGNGYVWSLNGSGTNGLGACRACPTGSLVDFGVQRGAPTPLAWTQCWAQGDRFFEVGADCIAKERTDLGFGPGRALPSAFSTTVPQLAEGMDRNPAAPGRVAKIDGYRRVWVGPTLERVEPLFLDEVVLGDVERDGRRQLVSAKRLVHAVSDAGLLVDADLTEPALAVVPGTPWVVSGDRRVREPNGRVVAQVRGAGALESPALGVLAPQADGGRQLVVSTGASLTANALPVGLVDGGVELVARTVPLAGNPIVALAPVPPGADAGVVARVWALTAGGLFRVDAETQSRWRSTEFPVGQGEAVEVWAEAERARIGFRSGEVLALPSRVRVAPDSLEYVLDYQTHCGGVFALEQAEGAGLVLQRLGRDATGPVWLPMFLALRHPELPNDERARLVPTRGGLLVTSAGGVTAFVPITGCP